MNILDMINFTIKKILAMAKIYWIIDSALITSRFRKIDDIGELWSKGKWITCMANAIIIRTIAILRIALNILWKKRLSFKISTRQN